MVEEAIIAKLLASAGVLALVSSRVFPVSRPQGSALPAVTIQRIDGAPILSDEGNSELENVRLQIDCWGSKYTDAKKAARAVIAELNAFAGTLSGVYIPLIELEAERDMPREGATAQEYLFRTSLDVSVWRSGP